MRHSPFAPLPAATARAVQKISHPDQRYISIGDSIEAVLQEVDLGEMDSSIGESDGYLAILALITLFQLAEGLSDNRAVEALQQRVEWKYALHLPVIYPRLDPSALCEFRQRLMNDQDGKREIHNLARALARRDLLGCGSEDVPEADKIITRVCMADRLERVKEAMSLAIETLAAAAPDWLRANALPHWFERYLPSQTNHREVKSDEELFSQARAIGTDIAYLLKALDQSNEPRLSTLPEIRALFEVWLQQYEPIESNPTSPYANHNRRFGCGQCRNFFGSWI